MLQDSFDTNSIHFRHCLQPFGIELTSQALDRILEITIVRKLADVTFETSVRAIEVSINTVKVVVIEAYDDIVHPEFIARKAIVPRRNAILISIIHMGGNDVQNPEDMGRVDPIHILEDQAYLLLGISMLPSRDKATKD